MQRHLTLVLTRVHWINGPVDANFRNLRRFTSLAEARREIATLADGEWEVLGIREGDIWVWIA